MTERPRQVFRAPARPGWSDEMRADPRCARARKRSREVRVQFAASACEVATPEGSVYAYPGDAILTAAAGERWCVPGEHFPGKYQPVPPTRMGEPGVYRSLPTEILARRMEEPFEVILRDERSRLRGGPGDWLVDYGDGTLGIVAQAIFAGTYDLIDADPMPSREVRTRIIDSTRWREVRLRASDIVVASWGKSGTTLTVQMVWQLLSNGAEGMVSKAPWVEALPFAPKERMLAAIEALPDPRLLKTHLPFDALVFHPEVRYLYVGRDARDVIWSAYNHHVSLTADSIDAFNASGGSGPLIAPFTGSARDYYLHWLEHGELPGFTLNEPFWEHVRGWWGERHRPNICLLHHARLTADPEGELRRLAAFLGIRIDEAVLPRMLAHCRIDYMRAHAAPLPGYRRIFARGSTSFFHEGTNGRWREVLSAVEIARCDAIAARELPEACARWLRTGEEPG